METKIPNTEKAIDSAFDSVNLINRLVTETADEKKKKSVERNVRHLELMLTKDFFKDALTESQKNDIDASILSGNNYIV